MLKDEMPIQGSPIVTLSSGNKCIPQHFLQFSHSLESVKKLFKRVSFSSNFSPYIYEDKDSLCMQIEIVGHENYPNKAEIKEKKQIKKVYGRKWRIERNLPTSEILQTAVLAIKKALEHEIREVFSYKVNGKRTTPLNNHQDFPLITREFDNLLCESNELCPKEMQTLLRSINFNKQDIEFLNISKHKSTYLLDIRIGESKINRQDINFFKWLELKEFTLVLNKLTKSEIIYSLMDLILYESDRYVEENFRLDGIPRFSRNLSPIKISQLSLQTRDKERLKLKQELIAKMKEINTLVDKTRIPITL